MYASELEYFQEDVYVDGGGPPGGGRGVRAVSEHSRPSDDSAPVLPDKSRSRGEYAVYDDHPDRSVTHLGEFAALEHLQERSRGFVEYAGQEHLHDRSRSRSEHTGQENSPLSYHGDASPFVDARHLVASHEVPLDHQGDVHGMEHGYQPWSLANMERHTMEQQGAPWSPRPVSEPPESVPGERCFNPEDGAVSARHFQQHLVPLHQEYGGVEGHAPYDQTDHFFPHAAAGVGDLHVDMDDRFKSESSVEEEEEDEMDTEPKTIVYRAVSWYAMVLTACPTFCSLIGILILAVISGIAVGVFTPVPNMDFAAFMKTDVQVSIQRDAYKAAMEARSKDSARRLAVSLFTNYDVHLAYELKEGNNMLADEILAEVARFEAMIRGLPGWKRLCDQANDSDRALCQYGVSFINYAMPSPTVQPGNVVPSSLTLNGAGRDPVPIETTFKLMQDANVADIVLPTGTTVKSTSVDSLRTCFRFVYFCCTTLASKSEQKAKLNSLDAQVYPFMNDELYPILLKAAHGEVDGWDEKVEGKKWPLRVYFKGSKLDTKLADDTFMGDLNLAGGSMAFVLVYLLLHCRSIVLGIFGFIIVMLGVPMAYLVLTLITGSRNLHVANFLSVFLVVGLGSDVIFVYVDFWRQSSIQGNNRRRAAWTLMHSAKASLATTATTCVSFFANMTSVLKPLREFGFFMGLSVFFVWVNVTLLFVPLCLMDETWCGRIRLRLPSWRPRMTSRTSATKIEGFTHVVANWRRTILAVTVLFTVLFLSLAGALVETDTSMPNIYPMDHPLNRMVDKFKEFHDASAVFDPLYRAPASSVKVCSANNFTDTSTLCPMYWCEAAVRPGVTDVNPPSDCSCVRTTVPGGNCGTDVYVKQRFVGKSSDAGQALDYSDRDTIIQRIQNTTKGKVGYLSALQSTAPLLLQEWESGQSKLMAMSELSAQVINVPANVCSYNEVCYCGALACRKPGGWEDLPGPSLEMHRSGTARRLQPRRLQQWTVPVQNRATIQVVFGIDVKAEVKLLGEVNVNSAWVFSPDFDNRHHWTQRNIMSFCTDLPDSLRVTSRQCWIEQFRDFVVNERGERFPIAIPSLFDDIIVNFANSGLINYVSASEYLWMREKTAKASFMSFQVDVSTSAGSATGVSALEKWNSYVDAWNFNAQATARGAWHTSDLWVKVEAQSQLISSTISTLIVTLVLAFFGMLCVTRSMRLSLFVVLATFSVICGLAFFIIVVVQWKIGPVEVIALIVFTGYAVTYSLHIAHCYGSHEALKVPEAPVAPLDIRKRRTAFAINSIGGAAIGSAVTTLGSALFLLFCTLTIFQKLGGVVLVVTFLSILVAMITVPAALMVVGPLHPGNRCLPTEREGRTAVQDMIAKVGNIADRLSNKWGDFQKPAKADVRLTATSAGPRGEAPRGYAGGARLAGGPGDRDRPLSERQPVQAPQQAGQSQLGRWGGSGVPGGPSTAGFAAPPAGFAAPPGAGLAPYAQSPRLSPATTFAPAQRAQAAQSPPLASAEGSRRQQRLAEMDLDIGAEPTLERIWVREPAGGQAPGPRPWGSSPTNGGVTGRRPPSPSNTRSGLASPIGGAPRTHRRME